MSRSATGVEEAERLARLMSENQHSNNVECDLRFRISYCFYNDISMTEMSANCHRAAFPGKCLSGVRFFLATPARTARVRTGREGRMQGNSQPPKEAAQDEAMMRIAYRVAARARQTGNHPFGAVLVGADGTVLMEQENAFLPDRDMTGHAERVLMTRASRAYPPEVLADCTLYSSAEPCAMCAGAAYWAGIGRVVYGLSEARLKALTGNHPENPTLDLPCRTVFAAGQRSVAVTGPILEDEGAALHQGAW